ncbi:glycoside hydrolase family 32 protein [Olivibacter sp. SDN3]|uniref:glycoside hydrolase family 32 protein n=1 Tax=Olivibacter sp. SDN3 TaxID=2764720 RepID=UPI001650F755|nr:glycoside hydrolase family 32 protein [Olivibacter sp. SDN3]QNL49340.1 glycoside hydrolase family 32 protein [Olivibacter sp. SDN3]
MKKSILTIFSMAILALGCDSKQRGDGENDMDDHEQYRPQFHFSPKNGWMNDPNGMVYLNGKYHLFFQHNPDSNVWGPMHWGHAISEDLIHWEEQAIALFPDSLGTIFSGSAVVDKDNTAGFGENALVAIFTHHSHEVEEAKTGLHQNQSLAYSTDEGKTWTKYEGNPVLPNPGIWDFRDPKVMWHENSKQWIMTLATKQTITFYGSPDLKQWTRLSEFGENIGAHGGVWECPDLFSLSVDGEGKWVLIVSINPGGPNGGSATQYFVGQFDGKSFVPDHQDTRWLDYGPDDYAGITWSNTGDRKVFIGWMNNWQYANEVPTEAWRGAATIARELELKKVGEDVFLTSTPVKELEHIVEDAHTENDLMIEGNHDLSTKVKSFEGKYLLELKGADRESFAVKLANELGEEILIGYDKQQNTYYIDRSKSGKIDFESDFGQRHEAPRIAKGEKLQMKLLIDVASVELFADDGLSVMTSVFFPNQVFDQLLVQSSGELNVGDLTVANIQHTL